MRRVFSKAWISPMTAILFTVVTVTGICMFFHVGPGSFKFLHKWVSWGLVAVGLLHLCVNFKVLMSYLKTKAALISIAVGIILCVAVAMQAGPPQGGGPGRPGFGQEQGERGERGEFGERD